VTHSIILRPAAVEDLAAIYDWIVDRADYATATAYRDRVLAACARLADFPNRGSARDDVRQGLRTIAFERRAVIVYVVKEGEVRIARVLHHGRDLSRAFEDPNSA
jgi:toxin ParE1/3/4